MDNSRLSLFRHLLRRLRFLSLRIYQRFRVWKYKFFSDINQFSSRARFAQPVLLTGRGKIKLGCCNLGVWPSPYYLNGYIHIEARDAGASVEIESGVWINNNAVIIAERSRVYIGLNTLIGTEFTVYDSDFHDLHPDRRITGSHKCEPVHIGMNVFIGSRVMVMKGVNIGDNCVIASGSVVTQSLPANCIAGGSPARLIRYIQDVD